jgi:hypothetical protein
MTFPREAVMSPATLRREAPAVKREIEQPVRVTLPGGVSVEWTPDEIAEAMRLLTASLLAAASGRDERLVLAHPQIVRYDDRHARLTTTQYAVVRLLLAHGSRDFDQIRDSVWLGKPVSDKRIANVCCEITANFCDNDVPYEVTAEGGRVSLRAICFPGNPGQIRETDR